MSHCLLKNTRILLGITGGIACYKSADLCRRLKKAGAEVQAIMTEAATQFITPLTLETLSGRPVYWKMFERSRAWEIEHIAFARWGNLLVVAPATANSIAKMAQGIADDPLTTTALAFRGPLLIVPAMNTAMWEHPQTQANITKLRERGAHILQPDAGTLACGEVGAGRMPDPEVILQAIEHALQAFSQSGPLAGKKVLITAGPTEEPIDPVRHITNSSSGRTGYALAAEAQRRGALVTLIAGPTSLQPPEDLHQVVRVRTTREMHDAVLAALPEQNICIFSAAPMDFAAETVADQKIKKEESETDTTIRFVRTPDIAKAANAQRKPGQFFLGFAAETSNLVALARAKMQAKGFDMIVANLISPENPAFAAAENAVTILGKSGEPQELPRMPKEALAAEIWNRIVESLKSK